MTGWAGNQNPPSGLVRELLAVQHAAALKFLAIGHGRLLEPSLRGDAQSARAALPAAEFAYEAHRKSVDATAVASHALADHGIASLETAVDQTTRWTVARKVGVSSRKRPS